MDIGKRCYEEFAGIRDMVGDLRNFDVKIKTTGVDTDTNYTPVPMTTAPLTDAEKSLEKYDFATICQKLTKDQVLDLMTGKGFQNIFGNNDASGDGQPDLDEADFKNNN